ncbi:beta-lactamase class C and other penicillin binding proteins [Eubacterium sp. CAG:786]|nr:beta-lactamase class C and other penicillin binding proteins [Eubacterium sp. CAG:786]
MTSNQLSQHQLRTFDWEQNIGCGYGNLMHIATDEGKAGISTHLGEYGWDGWLGCFWVNDPRDGYTFLYFIQRCGGLGGRPLRMMKQIVYSAED